MAWQRSETRSFFPWERRGGLIRRLGLYRLGPLLVALGLLGLLALIAVREREQSGIRRTRAVLLDVRQALDAFLADHQGQCPESFAALADYGPFKGTPRDAWGQPLTLICPGTAPGERYRLLSAGPDGVAGGLDRIE
jgi:type II secretory pathway pseudopilin PulG